MTALGFVTLVTANPISEGLLLNGQFPRSLPGLPPAVTATRPLNMTKHGSHVEMGRAALLSNSCGFRFFFSFSSLYFFISWFLQHERKKEASENRGQTLSSTLPGAWCKLSPSRPSVHPPLPLKLF